MVTADPVLLGCLGSTLSTMSGRGLGPLLKNSLARTLQEQPSRPMLKLNVPYYRGCFLAIVGYVAPSGQMSESLQKHFSMGFAMPIKPLWGASLCLSAFPDELLSAAIISQSHRIFRGSLPISGASRIGPLQGFSSLVRFLTEELDLSFGQPSRFS